jgi:hypothetical protein
MAELKYLTLWKGDRLVFMKREEFERRSFWQKIYKEIKQLIRKKKANS